MSQLFRLLFAIIISVLAIGPVGCASTTQITSEPAQALVRIDNIPLGKTPVAYTDQSVWLWTNRHVTVERNGYEPAFGRIKAEFVPGYVIAGAILFFCFIPMAWVALIGQYRPQYHFVLNRKQALETALVADPQIDFEY